MSEGKQGSWRGRSAIRWATVAVAVGSDRTTLSSGTVRQANWSSPRLESVSLEALLSL